MSSFKTLADARRAGHDFVALLHGVEMDLLLPSSKHNQLVLGKLIHDTLAASAGQDVSDEQACTQLQKLCLVVLALFDEGRLLSGAPQHVREAFLDALEIAGQATDVQRQGVLQ